MKRKLIIATIFIIVCTFVVSSVFRERYGFHANRASTYATEHAFSKSHNRCALHIMLAMNAGGQPVPLLRACDYDWYFKNFLPTQFEEVPLDGYTPQNGDVVIFPNVPNHPYGHIAMWNGSQWVSDFKQKNIIVAPEYLQHDYVIYRPIFVIQ